MKKVKLNMRRQVQDLFQTVSFNETPIDRFISPEVLCCVDLGELNLATIKGAFSMPVTQETSQ